MRLLVRILFSIFFAISIGVHIYYVIYSDSKPLWWHFLYFLTYGVCWMLVLSKQRSRKLLYGTMALFPFVTHVYYAIPHASKLDGMFWVCVLVCVMLPLGLAWIIYDERTILK